jgi:hypothetical protein
VFFGFGSFGLAWGFFCNFVSAHGLSSAADCIAWTWACGVGRLAFSGQTALAAGVHAARGWATRVGPGQEIRFSCASEFRNALIN